MTQSQLTANCVLLRYDGGHTYVDRSAGGSKHEIFVQLKGVKDLEHAREIGAEILSLHQAQTSTLNVQGTVRTLPQLAGAAFHLGDNLRDSLDADGRPVLAIVASSTDERGYAQILVQTGDPVAMKLASMDRYLTRIAAGAVSEYAAPVVNSQTQGSSTSTTPPPFSQSGQVLTQLSPAWPVPKPFQCTWLEADLVTPGTGTTRVRLYLTTAAGATSTVGTLLLNAGDKKAVVIPSLDGVHFYGVGYPAKSRLTMAVDMAGTGATNLTVTARGTMV